MRRCPSTRKRTVTAQGLDAAAAMDSRIAVAASSMHSSVAVSTASTIGSVASGISTTKRTSDAAATATPNELVSPPPIDLVVSKSALGT